MITGFDRVLFDTFLDDFVRQVKHAIESKPISRYTQRKGQFQAVVNTTGKLRDSVKVKYTADEIQVVCLSYIQDLIYGLAPGKYDGRSSDIDNWLAAKGLEYNPFNVQQNLLFKGNSIWQYFKGADSGLLGEVDFTLKLEELKEQLAMSNINQIKSEILTILKAA